MYLITSKTIVPSLVQKKALISSDSIVIVAVHLRYDSDSPFTILIAGRRQIGAICMSLQGNALLSADDLENAHFTGDRGEVRMWAVSQPPTFEEMLESDKTREEYEKLANALAACNPEAFPEPSRQKKLVFPLIERIVVIGAPADVAVSKGRNP